MNAVAVAAYHRLPASLKSVVASGRGVWLRRWRFGPRTERMVDEAAERDSWSSTHWAAWRQERLAFVLNRAVTRVPYYRDLWAERRRIGDRRPWDQLENWPILEKADLRADARRFVADDRKIARMFHEHTSGTTATPLDLWQSQDTLRQWYALFELRCRRWHGVSRHDRWANLGGQLVVPVSQRQPPFWVWNGAFNQLYMSSYHLAPDLIPHYLDALARYRVTYLWGYSSSLYELAQGALQSRRRDITMRIVLTNAEPLFEYQREAIREAFQCDVRETYGMSEMAAAASECPFGVMHEWPEAGWVEVADEDGTIGVGREGDLIATGLLNADMPLIRYRVGDRVTRAARTAPCPCGRTLPAFGAVQGRCDDTLYTRDGRRVGRLDPVFKQGLPIREAQVVQESLTRTRVLYVPLPGFNTRSQRQLADGLCARLGDVEIVFESVDAVPRGANGKFRAVVCAIPADERSR